MGTVNLQVSAGFDDAEQKANDAAFGRNGATLSIRADADSSIRRNCGFRFLNVAVAKDATIDSATFSVWPQSTVSDDASLVVWGEDADDTVTFASSPSNTVNERVLTTANVAWSEDSLGTGAFVSPSDIKTIIQEIVNRGSWASGNDLCIICYGVDGTSKNLTVDSYDTESGNPAKLDITYAEAGGFVPYPRPRGVRGGMGELNGGMQ